MDSMMGKVVIKQQIQLLWRKYTETKNTQSTNAIMNAKLENTFKNLNIQHHINCKVLKMPLHITVNRKMFYRKDFRSN